MSAGTLSPLVSTTKNPLTNSADRESQIRAAASEMVKARERWSQSDDQFFPEWLETTISASLNIILKGDVPGRCVPLYQAAVLLASYWEKIITTGEGLLPSGIPGRVFWDQFDALTRCLTHVETIKSRYIAPVKQQLEEFAGDPRKYQYVAKNYGYQEETPDGFIWKGPFFVNGSVDARLIEQEMAQPGSVIPAGWHPDDERKKKEQKIVEESGSALARIRDHLNRSGVKTESAGNTQSIEKMIRDGQLLGQICRIANVDESHVREVAKAIGVPVYNKEEYAQMLQEKTAIVKAETAPPMQSGQPVHPESSTTTAGKDEESGNNSGSDTDSDSLTPEEFLSAILEANPEITTPEVVTAAKSAGLAITGQWVGRRLAALRKAAGSAVGAVASAVVDAVSGEPSTSPAETSDPNSGSNSDPNSDSEY